MVFRQKTVEFLDKNVVKNKGCLYKGSSWFLIGVVKWVCMWVVDGWPGVKTIIMLKLGGGTVDNSALPEIKAYRVLPERKV